MILEFKRAPNENVINQGCSTSIGSSPTARTSSGWCWRSSARRRRSRVDWSTPRLICNAGDFSRYDAHAIKQVSRHIELILPPLRRDLLMLEKVASTAAGAPRPHRGRSAAC